jgi:hypothetical protein
VPKCVGCLYLIILGDGINGRVKSLIGKHL